MHMIKAIVQGKMGRLEAFVQNRQEELSHIHWLEDWEQVHLIVEMIRQITPECESVRLAEQSGWGKKVICTMKNGWEYIVEWTGLENTRNLPIKVMDEVVLPYTLDLWEELQTKKN